MRQIDEIAASQHGLITRHQLFEAGVSRWTVRRWAESHRIVPAHRGVFALAGSPRTVHQEVLAKILATDVEAAASHTTAAWLWGVSGYRPHPIHVVVNRHRRHHEMLPWKVHQFTGLPRHHVKSVDRIPVTSPALTMLHLAQMVSEGRLGRAIDSAWSLGILSGRDLFDLDQELARRGRNGIVALREAAEARGVDWVPPQSNLESRFMSLIDPVGAHGFERQVTIRRGSWAARVDFLHRSSRTVVEVQSERYHAALTSREDDAERIARLEAAGFTVVEVWDTELFYEPDSVRRRVWTSIYRAA
ncbi:MAG: type IV toxin-antitoxin system AbiEi family antitoxin domain-containing protein [Acidimicrobiia bacterium]|nr:type IV toxin-antitoxin system AbiEi family antitoxin domain-containing protein [Acidimicrobiia bacterium]